MLPFMPRRKDNLAAWLVRAATRRTTAICPRLPVPETEGGLRAAAGRRPDQPGSNDLAADHAVESAGIASDVEHADGDSDRGVAHLRQTPILRGRRPHSRAHASSSSYCDQIVMEQTLEAGWRDSLAARPAHAHSRTPPRPPQTSSQAPRPTQAAAPASPIATAVRRRRGSAGALSARHRRAACG